ncbi:MAG TPA: 3-carboxy-cis,cis-muconate cycloisomerase [Ktedonobacterales bacterium]
MNTHARQGLLDLLFSTEPMRDTFSDHARIQAMLDFERALAMASADGGLLPSEAASAIASQCDAQRFNPDELARGATLAGNLAIPLVDALTDLVSREDEPAARFVHWGATSQDAIDSGLVLQMRQGLDLLDSDLARLIGACAKLAHEYAKTPIAGRTWLQQATPITFGLKVAGWLSAARRSQSRLRDTRNRALTLQFGGASGSLATFGEAGPAVVVKLAAYLELPKPDLPWHTQRDRIAEVATTLGLLVGSLGKIARDVSLLSQSEVAEASEPHAAGRGVSSSMPQKRNPVGSAVALAAAQRVPGLVATLLAAMPQEHERGLGGWQAEWDVVPEIFLLAAGALGRMVEVVEGLTIDSERMRANLEGANGLLYAESVSSALARSLGRKRAQDLVRDATRRATTDSIHLRQALASIPEIEEILSPGALDALFDIHQATAPSERLTLGILDD